MALGRISLQISMVNIVDELLKIEVRLETRDAIITDNISPRAPDGRRFNTNDGYAMSVQPATLPQISSQTRDTPQATVSKIIKNKINKGGHNFKK